jgi:Fe-S cluster biogenesis protein NfuA
MNGEGTLAEVVKDVIEGFRPGFQADGADLEVLDVGPETVRIRLVTGPETCEECLLPRESLEALFANALAKRVGGSVRVRLEDPREEAS